MSAQGTERHANINNNGGAHIATPKQTTEPHFEDFYGQLDYSAASRKLVKPRDGPCADHGRVEELGRGEEAVRRTGMTAWPGDVKIPGFDGTGSWEAFAMQLTIFAQLHGWTDSEKASRLTAALRGEAQLVPLNLFPNCLGRYQSLSEALARRFGNLSDPEGLKLRLRRCLCRKGESLARLASELERESRRAYAFSTPAEQEEQARLQFVEALGPRELRKHLRLQRPLTLQAALRLAQEWEEATADEGAEGPRHQVRLAQPCEDKTEASQPAHPPGSQRW
ncbi:UNVERIFIED_CONTAM: hypothetical protein FKN15_070515 [Acipenser sinensis]